MKARFTEAPEESTMKKNMKQEGGLQYFLYARRSIVKSDREEKVVSTESQMKEMREIAEKEGLRITRTFEETISAKKPFIRPQFNEMIERIKKGEANGILVWKMDRLSRNPIDEGTIRYLLQEGVIKNIRATDRNWYPDDNSLISSVEFGVATQYSRDLAKHIKRGLRAKVQEGHRPSIAPMGYKNSKYREKGKETVLVDDNTFPLVRKLFDLALTGQHNTMELTRIANNKLGLRTRGTARHPSKKVCKSNVHNILRNPFYYGEFEYPIGSGLWHKGKHVPMISKSEHLQIQEILHNRGKPRKVKHLFAYRMLIRCGECGAFITCEEKFKNLRNGERTRHVYYRCTKRIDRNCSQMPIREADLEDQIKEFMGSICIPKSFYDWAVSQLDTIAEVERATKADILRNHERNLKACEERVSRLLDLRLSNEVSSEEFSKAKARIETERVAIENAIQDTKAQTGEGIGKIKEKASFAESLIQKFDKADVDTKRELLRNLGSNHTLKDRKLYVTIQKPLLLLKELENLDVSPQGRLDPENAL